MATDTAIASTTSTSSAETKEMRLYKCHLLSCKYIFTSGAAANFINGKYATAVESEIAELDALVKSGHPHIYVDKDQVTIDYDHTNPLAELRKKFFEEFEANRKAQLESQATRDLGVAVHGTLKGANTTDIAPVTIGNASTRK